MSYLKPMTVIRAYGENVQKVKVFAERYYQHKALLSKDRFYKHILYILGKPEPLNTGI